MWFFITTVNLTNDLYLYNTKDKARTAFREMLMASDELSEEMLKTSTEPCDFYSDLDQSLVTWGKCPTIQ